jgi:predicted nucleic acid-binding protein
MASRKKVLEELTAKLVMKKLEITEFLKNKAENPSVIADSITKALSTQGVITYVKVIGESCIAITQKGMRSAGR